MAYYGAPQWPGEGQAAWEHQAPPTRSGANSAIPRDEPGAFWWQFEEVDRAVDNLVKSGKMFGGGMGGRHNRMMGPGPRGHGLDFEGRNHPGGLQNFYASQRHQSSRGSNDAEQVMQAKRRMAAQRERELRNYHQEQQYNRTVLADMTYGPPANKADRALSPGNMGEDERRELIARQRSALYGEGQFAETGGYVDETGNTRPGMPTQNGPVPASLRGRSPLAYDYGRVPQPLSMSQEQGAQSAGGVDPSQGGGPPNQRSRANSTSSPQSNPPAGMGKFDYTAQQATRTSSSSPGGSPPRQGGPPGSKPTQSGPGSVAPIGTRPSATSQTPPNNPVLSKRSTTPLPSPLGQGGYKAGAPGSVSAGGAGNGGNDDSNNSANNNGGSGSNPASATTEMGGGWNGSRSAGGVWGSANKSGLGAVWG